MPKRLSIICIMFLLLPLSLAAGSPLSSTKSPPELAGESLVYDIAFLWFDHLAEGRFTFTAGEQSGTYRAELEAKTLGVAGWLTGDRVQRYASIMEVGPNGNLRSLYHESLILKSKGKEQKQSEKKYVFDYQKGEVCYERMRGGKLTDRQFLPIDKGAPQQDVLTAFIGFRLGQAGALQPGQIYRIPTFSHKGMSEIMVETVAAAERSKYPFPLDGLLTKVSLSQEVFDTGEGYIYIWFDEKGRPAKGIVENVIGMGNVRGTLR